MDNQKTKRTFRTTSISRSAKITLIFNQGQGAGYPHAVAVDLSGNIYVADTACDRIQEITPGGEVITIAGSGKPGYKDGAGEEAQFNAPSGVAVDSSGNVYVANAGNHRIRKIEYK